MSDLVKPLAMVGAIIGVLPYGLEGAIAGAIVGAIVGAIIEKICKCGCKKTFITRDKKSRFIFGHFRRFKNEK